MERGSVAAVYCSRRAHPIALRLPVVVDLRYGADPVLTVNLHWFETLGEPKAIVEAWRRDYNESCPHSALKGVAPAEFARQLVLSVGPAGPETPQNSL